MKKLSRITILGLLCALLAFSQANTLVQTSLTAAMTSTQTLISVASATGINAPSFSSGLAGSALYVVDIGQTKGDWYSVVAITGTATTVRKLSGSHAHASGAMVLVATNANWFVSSDPVGSCTAASTYVTPVLNINTGLQWICSTITLTWVPGWGNYSAPAQDTLLVASVGGTTAVSGPKLHINGTNAVTAFLPTIGWNGQSFTVIPDAGFTTTTGGTTVATTRVIAIAKASTAVAAKTLTFTYDATNALFVPVY